MDGTSKIENKITIDKKFDTPCDSTNFSHPQLINTRIKDSVIGPEGLPITAEYIWSKNGNDRVKLVEYVFNFFRSNGFPYPKESDQELLNGFKKLKNTLVNSIVEDGCVKNSNSNGTNIIKHFCGEKFYHAKTNKDYSPFEVFNDDELFMRVLKNRMGWNTIKDNNMMVPYMFNISPSMIIQGIRSSGLGSSISQFKPAVAKYLYSKYCPKGITLDYSGGWGARLLGALSIGVKYYGIDPLTSDNLNSMNKFFNGNAEVINGCSEDENLYKSIPMVDFIFSSPPYFNLEKYNDSKTQSYNKFEQYNEWLYGYWDKTVKNCCSVLKFNGHFGIAVVTQVGKVNLADDMIKICKDNGLELIETLPMKTSRSHLSGKATSRECEKFTDGIYIFRKP